MDTAIEERRSQRDRKPVERYDPSEGEAPRPKTQRPSSQQKAADRLKALRRESVMEDIKAASIPVSYYEELEASFSEEFYAGDNGRAVPCYEPTMEELEDPEKILKHAVAMAVEKDTAFTKVRMPSEWVKKLRAVSGYPYFHPLMLNAVREKIRVYDKDGEAGAYIRETEFYDSYLAREFTFPEEINNVPQDIRPKQMLGTAFDPELQDWRDFERNFWEDIPKTFNNNVLYAPEVDGSLFPKSYTPFCMNGMIGFLDDALKSQGHISGIYSNVVYFGQARSSFPWHTEDYELLSANYHHLGAPKLWYGLAPSQKKLTYATFRDLYRLYFDHCPQEPRHKRLFTLPAVLEKAGIEVTRTVQRAGDLIVTRPWGYHMGISFGLNVTEAVNAGYDSINTPIIEKVHKNEWFCRCAYNVTGVILDYQLFGANGHKNLITILNEELAKTRLQVAELQRLLRGGTTRNNIDGLAPSTSSAAPTTEATSRAFEGEDHFDIAGDADNDFDFPHPSSPGAEPLIRCSSVKRRRVHALDSDDEDEAGPAPSVNQNDASLLEDDVITEEDDGRAPSAASAASKATRRGWNPFTEKEKAAVVKRMVSDNIYNKDSGKFTAGFHGLGPRMKPTGISYWKRHAGKGALKGREPENLRAYFRRNFGEKLKLLEKPSH